MKKHRFYLLLLCMGLITSLLTGCGAASKSTSSADFNTSTSGTEATEVSELSTENTPLPNTKLIYTANIAAESTNFPTTISEIESLAKSSNGYIEYSKLSGQVGSRSVSYVLRIPQSHYADFIKTVGNLCTITNKSEKIEDVSETYFDRENRLKTQITKQERLLSLLAQATNIEDIISLENALADVQSEIDSLQGTLNKYDSLINFSTIELSIKEVHTLSTMPESMTFISDIKQAFTEGTYNFVHFMRNLLVGIAGFWPLVIIICILLVFARIKGYHHKNHSSKNDWASYLTKNTFDSKVQTPENPAFPTKQTQNTDQTDPPADSQ